MPRSFVLSLSLPFLAAACASAPASERREPRRTPAALGGPLISFGPRVAANTPEQWATLEGLVASALGGGRKDGIAAPFHVVGQGYSVEHRFDAKGGRCYRLGVAWSAPLDTYLGTGFPKDAQGRRVNDQVGVQSHRLGRAPNGPSTGVVSFCADHSGEVLLSFSGIAPSGVAVNATVLEYAVAASWRKESGREAKARRQSEAVAVAEAEAVKAENLRRAKLASGCERCDDEFDACLVLHPRYRCRSDWRSCTRTLREYAEEHNRDKACGPAPL